MNANNRHSIPETRAATVRRTTAWVAGLLGVISATAALAQGTVTAITGGLETGTKLVSLPAAPSGTLAATQCSNGCPILRLRFDGNTRYYIGKNPVPYAKFREAASKGDLYLLVVYRYSDNTLTRLRIPATVNQ